MSQVQTQTDTPLNRANCLPLTPPSSTAESFPSTPPPRGGSSVFTPTLTSTTENYYGKASVSGATERNLIDSNDYRDDSRRTSWLRNPFSSRSKVPTKPPHVPQYYKELGYRAFSQLLASEQTFFMVRRFGALNARVALCLQDKLTELSDRLDGYDEDNTHPQMGDVHNGTFREEHDSNRKKLIEGELLNNLTKYNNFINSYAQLVNRPAVRPEARSEVYKWLQVHKKVIHDEEAAYIEMEDDLIAVHPKEKSWFRHILEWTLVFQLPIFRRVPHGVDFSKEEESGVVFQHDGRLEKFSSAVIAFIGLGMLIGPLWILNKVQDTESQLGVITGFIALFFVLVAVATNAKIFESLAAAAAYSAVLMVFLQMGTSNTRGPS